MTRTLICQDSFPWLRDHPKHGSVITVVPDAYEINLPINRYIKWLREAFELCLQTTADDGIAIFCQTDRKHDGEILSKLNICINTGLDLGYKILWHKIVMVTEPGVINMIHQGYSNMIAFSKKGRPGKATPDIIVGGKKLWNYGIGIRAAEFMAKTACRYGKIVIDPFVGRGTLIAMAEYHGADVIGIDIDPDCIEFTRNLDFRPLDQYGHPVKR